MLRLLILIELLRGKNTQIEIADSLKVSQQRVSYNLRKLEKEGLVKGKKLTAKGQEFLLKLHKELSNSLLERKRMEIEGVVFSGVGEGKKFLSIRNYKEGIKKKLGFSPFEGTLNIRLDEKNTKKRAFLSSLSFEYLKGFKKDGKEYGGTYLKKCFINGVEGGIIIPIKSRYGYNVLEVVSPYFLREKLKLKDGDKVRVVL